MSELKFDTARMPVKAAADALGMDCQTIRLLLQSGSVSWGCAFKRGNSRRYSYLIYPKKFYEETGFVYQRGEAVKNDR